MQKRRGDDGYVWWRWLSGGLFLFVGLSLAVAAVRLEAGRAATPEKIAPWVMQQTAQGAEAEFLVILKEQADLGAAENLAGKEEKGRFVRETLWATAQTTQAPLRQWLRGQKIEHRAFYIVNALWVKADRATVLALAARPEVLRIEGNPQIKNPIELPSTNESSQPEAIAAVEPGVAYTRAPEVWALGFTGQGIVVGGADTGYRWDHNALKPHYRGWNGAAADHNYNWHDSIHSGGGSCGADSPAPCDDQGHGTHTIGTAIGDDGAGNQVGMAPGAKWIGCRNMDQGDGTPARYLECMEFFLAPYPVGSTPAAGDPTRAPDVTTNSWTCPASEGCSPATLQAGVAAQVAAGIMFVAAAGNAGPACSTVADPPAIYDEAYTIGALNTGADTIASFSSRGPVTSDGSMRRKPDLTAPGTSTRSSTRTSTSSYGQLSGTSMATPHVAGAVALLWSAVPRLRHDVAETRRVLNNTAIALASGTCDGGTPVSPNNFFGYGRLDVKRAVAGGQLLDSSMSRSGDDVVVSFRAIAGMNYRLERQLPGETNWSTAPGTSDLAAATTGTLQMTHSGGFAAPAALYRVLLLP